MCGSHVLSSNVHFLFSFLTIRKINRYWIKDGFFFKCYVPGILPQAVDSDPLANVDKDNVDVMMYCTGGIRCDVFSTMLRYVGFFSRCVRMFSRFQIRFNNSWNERCLAGCGADTDSTTFLLLVNQIWIVSCYSCIEICRVNV